MLTDIVSAIITSQEDFELAGEAASTAGLAAMAKDAAADVVVLGSPAASETSNYFDVLYARREMKIVAIDSDGRQAVLHELRLHVSPLGEVSAATLIAAIRGSFDLAEQPGS
jgi:hypothetical protein